MHFYQILRLGGEVGDICPYPPSAHRVPTTLCCLLPAAVARAKNERRRRTFAVFQGRHYLPYTEINVIYILFIALAEDKKPKNQNTKCQPTFVDITTIQIKKRQRLNVSTTPLRQWGFLQCLPFSWTTLRDKHCRHPIAIMGVVDTFGLWGFKSWFKSCNISNV